MQRIKNISFRRLAPWLVGTLVLVVAAGALVSNSKSDVTRARLERNLPQVFENIYVQQAALLGHKGVTVQSMKAKAQCDKGGPNVPDRGPGADWICVMSWHDPNVDETLMPGKFEINAHSNNCYTAGGPSKLVGLLTITDKNGKDVPNPAFEFDGCFNPNGSNKPTGVNLNPRTPAPTTPAALAIAAAALRPDKNGLIHPTLTCSPGQEGCGGTITATLNGQPLQTATYALAPGSNGDLQFQLSPQQATHGGKLLLTPTPVIGDAARAKTALAVKHT